ncbi:hypothetical protein A2U01_0112620, partial [Trifolium medium]|nr:hypothetical protein [Trifolium medium]
GTSGVKLGTGGELDSSDSRDGVELWDFGLALVSDMGLVGLVKG